jgi:hydrogenase expression/formation protein HypE
MGKLASEDLQKILNCIKKDFRVIVPPMIGFDAGVHLLHGKYVAVATDPCTGVPEDWFGWLLIHYASSDVALFGARPEFCTVNLLGPIGTEPEVFQKIMKQTCSAADELEIAIVRGHTGMYDSLKGLLGVCTVYGIVEPSKLITPGNANPGDLILCTKPLGMETVTNLSLTNPELAQTIFGVEQQKKLSTQVPMQSCVREALELAQIGGVHAMHDATEGGFFSALNELAQASKVGFRLEWEKFPFTKELWALQRYFKLSDEQLLAMSSTGTILAAVKPVVQEKVKTALAKNELSAYFIGEITENKERVLIRNGKETQFPLVADDPYTLIVSAK